MLFFPGLISNVLSERWTILVEWEKLYFLFALTSSTLTLCNTVGDLYLNPLLSFNVIVSTLTLGTLQWLSISWGSLFREDTRTNVDMHFFLSPRILNLIGYVPEELMGKTSYQFHYPTDAPKLHICHKSCKYGFCTFIVSETLTPSSVLNDLTSCYFLLQEVYLVLGLYLQKKKITCLRKCIRLNQAGIGRISKHSLGKQLFICPGIIHRESRECCICRLTCTWKRAISRWFNFTSRCLLLFVLYKQNFNSRGTEFCGHSR